MDTLGESRKLIKGLSNYKLNTVAKHFDIINENSHRASTDAKVCGIILSNLIKSQSETRTTVKDETSRKNINSSKNNTPRKDELEICAFIHSIIYKINNTPDLLRFYRNSSGYIDVSYFQNILKFKFAKKGKYVILPKEVALNSKLPVEPTSMTEGGSEYLRAFFNAPSDLENIRQFIEQRYNESYKGYLDFEEWSKGSDYYTEAMDSYFNFGIQLNKKQVDILLEQSKEKLSIHEIEGNIKYNSMSTKNNKYFTINPIHSRIPLSQIKNKNNWNQGFDEGFPFYEEAERLRKEQRILESIELFDKAREVGYEAPALYWSYALAYRKLKDYDNEIAVIDECLERLYYEDKDCDGYSRFNGRRQKAIELLLKTVNR